MRNAAPSDDGRPALRLVPPSPAVPAAPLGVPFAVVKHEITPSRWILQAHDAQGFPGVCVVVTRPDDQRRVEQLTAYLQDFYRAQVR